MQKKTAITLLVALLSCTAFSESHPKFGWKQRPTDKFELSNRAKRNLPLAVTPIGASETAVINVQLTSQYPVNMSVQNARGESLGGCYYPYVTNLAANCSMRWSSQPKYLVVEDANQAEFMQGKRGRDALNHVSLTINEYTCTKNCSKLQ